MAVRGGGVKSKMVTHLNLITSKVTFLDFLDLQVYLFFLYATLSSEIHYFHFSVIVMNLFQPSFSSLIDPAQLQHSM